MSVKKIENPPSKRLFMDEEDGASRLELVPSGSTILDLSLSGTLAGAYPIGRIVNLVGDKSTGKTLLNLEAMSSARKKWPDAVIRYAETEAAFDESFARTMGMPIDTFERPDPPIEEIGEFFKDVEQTIKNKSKEVPLIYVLDSLDAVMPTGEVTSTDYTAKGQAIGERARQLSKFFRKMKRPLQESNTLLMINSQVREKINAQAFGKKLYRAGGRALGHYATQEIWLSEVAKLWASSSDRTAIGIVVRVKSEKNKAFKAYRECEVNFLWDYGMDDLQGCLNFLGVGGGSGGWMDLFGVKKQRGDMIKHIETEGLMSQLRELVWEKWQVLEESRRVDRKSKWLDET